MMSGIINIISRFFRSNDLKSTAIDHLEILTPDELGELLIAEVLENFPDVQFIQDLLYVGCPVDAKDKSSWTVLHIAAWKGHLEIVKLLISNGAKIHIRDNKGRTALHHAARNGGILVIQFLLSKGADVYARTNDGKRACDYASKKNNDLFPELKPKWIFHIN